MAKKKSKSRTEAEAQPETAEEKEREQQTTGTAVVDERALSAMKGNGVSGPKRVALSQEDRAIFGRIFQELRQRDEILREIARQIKQLEAQRDGHLERIDELLKEKNSRFEVVQAKHDLEKHDTPYVFDEATQDLVRQDVWREILTERTDIGG